MRVVFLTHNYPRWPGDLSGSFLATLAAALVRRGIEVRVLAPSDEGKGGEEERDGVLLTSLDSPLGDGLDVTEGDLVEYVDAFADRLLPQLTGRPLSVKRVRPGQSPFMQRNVSKGAPDWVRTVPVWSFD